MCANRRDRPSSTQDRVLNQVVDALKRTDAGDPLHLVTRPDGDEAAIVHHTLLTILRRQASLDWVLTSNATGRIRPRTRRVLRWGLAQILYLRSLAPELAADTCVRFVRRRYAVREAGFVNALLRRLVDRGCEKLLADVTRDAPDDVRLELSNVLLKRWRKRLSAEELTRLSRAHLEPVPVTVRQRREVDDPGSLGLRPLQDVTWARDQPMWVCDAPAAFLRSSALHEGHFYVQDPATLLAPTLLAVEAGDRCADLCAAPGGKTLMLSEAAGEAGRVVCCDRSWPRLRVLRENTDSAPNCQVVCADAGRAPFAKGTFDRVLLDVPCSNTGVIRRRPDVRWRFSEEGLADVVRLQARILDEAQALVRPGGFLVYSTCSVEPEENAQQTQRFLDSHPKFA
ncbi:MAG: RsmB/NOP family class I SAM-dependent RNA methyltransferase, partial [Lentisphaerae bacterium]|nr:RsmB/NOP family class I SAM-dependent RNA methyltransferase [Lentisphaerota bacterium]